MNPVLVQVNGRWPLWMPPHRAVRPEWPWWEAHHLALMNHLIEPGMVVYDIGAEEGDFPALYALWGAEVCLVEPNPRVWPNIRYIFNHNQLDLPRWFVGLCSDTINLEPDQLDFEVFVSRDGWPNVAHGDVIGDHGFRHIADGQPSTPTSTIDSLRVGWPAPDVITMDVEGGEFHVLRGARHVLEVDRPQVVVSVHPSFLTEMYGETAAQLDEYMGSCGYEGRRICTDHEEHHLYTPR